MGPSLGIWSPPVDDDDEIPTGGAAVRHFRDLKGWTQQQLATAMDMSLPAVGQWEVGKIHPRRGTAQRLDLILGAKGRLLHALGYVTPSNVEPINATVITRIDELETALLDKLSQLEQLLRGRPPIGGPDDAGNDRPLPKSAKGTGATRSRR